MQRRRWRADRLLGSDLHLPHLNPLADSSRFGRRSEDIRHIVSTLYFTPLQALKGVKSLIVLFISRLGSHSSSGPETSIIYFNGEKTGEKKKAFERQILFDFQDFDADFPKDGAGAIIE